MTYATNGYVDQGATVRVVAWHLIAHAFPPSIWCVNKHHSHDPSACDRRSIYVTRINHRQFFGGRS